jgi:hypothetical protein
VRNLSPRGPDRTECWRKQHDREDMTDPGSAIPFTS